jgi:hypothetical protein
MLKFIFICCLLLITATVVVSGRSHESGIIKIKETPKDPSQPSLVISFEQSNLEIGDSIAATIQVTNTSAFNLSGLQLRIDGPGFLQYRDVDSHLVNAIMSLDDIPPYTTLRTSRFWIKAPASGSRVGDFNVLFTLPYKWNDGKLAHQNQATLEKTLNVGLLGNDKIMGIPLAFAGFVVPGLMFMFTLWLLKVPIGSEIGADDKIIASIVVSVFCLFLVSLIKGNILQSRMSFFDVGSSVSMLKLFMLALMGMFLGLLTFFGHIVYKRRERKRLEKLRITGDENSPELLEKILKLNPKYNGFPVQFTLKNGQTYMGAHYAEIEFDYILMGAYQVTTKGLPEKIRNKLKKHTYDNKGINLIQDARHLLAVLEMFKNDNTDNIEIRYFVKEVEENEDRHDVSDHLLISKEEFKEKRGQLGIKKMELLVIA